MAPAIPDRWLDYKPIGQIIKGTRFIAFKVPLRENVIQCVPPSKQLSCRSLLKSIPDLGMIIDLTNTKRYYDPEYFQSKNVEYNKLMIPGHEVPERSAVERFNTLANNFLQEKSNKNKLIGVHCTHGVNRTGYLISSFMISELKMNPQETIKCVEEARGHAIERNNYKEHLTRAISSGRNYQNYDNNRTSSNSYDSRTTQYQNNNWRSDTNFNSRSDCFNNDYGNYRFQGQNYSSTSRSSPYRARINLNNAFGRDVSPRNDRNSGSNYHGKSRGEQTRGSTDRFGNY